MKLGFSLPIAGGWATPENQVRLAKEAEALGYHSLWTLQRLLYALEPKSVYPPVPGPRWPPFMERVVDPIVTLAYVAAHTTRIRLGISVLVMPYFAPIVLAKQLATLDHVSGGRLDVGLGIGWSEDEYDAVGVPFRQRGKRGDEFIRCLRTIWTEEIVEFEGDFYRVPRSLVEPKPVQAPHPPILVGGYGQAAVRRAASLGDGFTGGNVPMVQVAPLIAGIGDAIAGAGRDPQTFRIVCRGTYRVYDSPQGPDRRPLFGTLDEIREDLGRYAEAGLTELFLEANVDAAADDETDAMGRTLAVMAALAPNR